jgi:hypothetical protein
MTTTRQHTAYKNWIKRIIAQNGGDAEYRKPGAGVVAAVEAAPVVEPVKRARKVKTAKVEPVVVEPVYTKEATPEQADAIYQALAEICETTGIGHVETVVVEPEPVKLETWKPGDTEGYPAKGDTLHLLTLTGEEYNGKRIPFPAGTIYPVYIATNQEGAIMRVPERSASLKPAEMVLGWHYRASSYSDALTDALEDLRLLKAWQRHQYGKHTLANAALDAGEIKLQARGTVENFEIYKSAMLAAVKGLGKKAYIDLAGYLFPAATLAAIVRLQDDLLTVTVNPEHTQTFTDSHGAPTTKTTPTLTIKAGTSKTTLLGMVNLAPNNFEIYPCSI